jgi:hypothetical protein
MLITLIDVVSCENPECREFARVVPNYAARTYYCPVCGNVSHTRTVDAELVSRPQDYRTYLCRHVSDSRVWGTAWQ